MNPIELVLLLLLVVAALQLVARRFGVPLPVLLVAGGLGLALVPGVPRIDVEPNALFLLFVPPLLYWAALTTSVRDFRANLRSISLLAIGLVLATIGAVAAVAHAVIAGLSWPAAFILGAIVAPSDAVAATAITRQLGVPRVIVTVLEGESLVNDAVAIVVYRVAIAAAVSGVFIPGHAALALLLTGVSGAAIGLAIGWLIGWTREQIPSVAVVENTISLLTGFAAYLPAEAVGASGVLSVVACGLYLSRRGPRIVSAATRIQADAVWSVLGFLLEGMIFILIGLNLRHALQALHDRPAATIAWASVAVSATVILIRLIWVWPGTYIPRWIRRRFGKPDRWPSWRGVLVVGWSGLRGGISLLLALAIPAQTSAGAAFAERNLIITLTFAVIFATLVLQGFSLGPLIRLLRLRPDEAEAREELEGRHAAVVAAQRRLDELASEPWMGEVETAPLREEYARLERLYSARRDRDPDDVEERRAEAYGRLSRELVDAERAEIVRLRDEGHISDPAMRRVQRDLDLMTLRADSVRHGVAEGKRSANPAAEHPR